MSHRRETFQNKVDALKRSLLDDVVQVKETSSLFGAGLIRCPGLYKEWEKCIARRFRQLCELATEFPRMTKGKPIEWAKTTAKDALKSLREFDELLPLLNRVAYTEILRPNAVEPNAPARYKNASPPEAKPLNSTTSGTIETSSPAIGAVVGTRARLKMSGFDREAGKLWHDALEQYKQDHPDGKARVPKAALLRIADLLDAKDPNTFGLLQNLEAYSQMELRSHNQKFSNSAIKRWRRGIESPKFIRPIRRRLSRAGSKYRSSLPSSS
jgi:hypothetical protein